MGIQIDTYLNGYREVAIFPTLLDNNSSSLLIRDPLVLDFQLPGDLILLSSYPKESLARCTQFKPVLCSFWGALVQRFRERLSHMALE